MSIKCPRCNQQISATPDATGVVTCPSCNTRLRPQGGPPPASVATQIDSLVAEVRALRRMQGEILQYQAQMLALLKASGGTPPAVAAGLPPSSPIEVEPAPDVEEGSEPEPPPIPRVRQRRKTVVILDDDPESLKPAIAVLDEAQIPVRSVSDGHAALAAVAEDKPDVLIVELGVGEPMPGKDFINHVKATMEWIDIPIVLYTRIFVQSQQEARLLHGADEVVLKGPGAPEALVNRVIALFQRR